MFAYSRLFQINSAMGRGQYLTQRTRGSCKASGAEYRCDAKQGLGMWLRARETRGLESPYVITTLVLYAERGNLCVYTKAEVFTLRQIFPWPLFYMTIQKCLTRSRGALLG